MKRQTRSIRGVDVVLILVLLLVLGLAIGSVLPRRYLPWLPPSADGTNVLEIPIPADRLVGGVGPLSPGQVVKIVASVPNASGTSELQTFTGLEVVGLVDEKGTVLVAVPLESAQSLQEALVTENARFTYGLSPQGMVSPTATPEATPTPEPTATTPSNSVAFDLPVDKIKSKADLGSLERGKSVVVIVVVESKDSEGNIVTHKAHRHDGAMLLDVLNKDGAPIAQPYEKVAIVRISVALGTNRAAEELAEQLADASAIYLLPAPLTPTPPPIGGG